MDHDLRGPLGLQPLRHQQGGILGVAVDAGVGDHDALALHPVARPDVIEVQVVAQILGEHGAVGGADLPDVQGGGLLQQGLDLGTVLAHDADEVAPGLVVPGLLHVQGAELAEAVGGEEDLVMDIVGHDDLGPVDHGRGDEGQGVLTQGEGVPLAHDNTALGIVGAEEALHHLKCLGGGHHGGTRIALQELVHIGGVIGLHVLDDQVIGGPAAQLSRQVLQPLVGKMAVHGVHDGDLLIQDHVGIVGNAVGNGVLALEEVHAVVVDADIANVVGNKHSRFSFIRWCCLFTGGMIS